MNVCGICLVNPTRETPCPGCASVMEAWGKALCKPKVGGDPRFHAILDEMRAMHERKSADYGQGEDPLANVRASKEFGVPAWVGCMVRANDKVIRIKSMVKNGKLENESVEDSLIDLAAYAILSLVLYREEKP